MNHDVVLRIERPKVLFHKVDSSLVSDFVPSPLGEGMRAYKVQIDSFKNYYLVSVSTNFGILFGQTKIKKPCDKIKTKATDFLCEMLRQVYN